ncbi:hypothetical protein BGP_4228 [Beggiatoa sp. PS]|nr:hypothetical protein BGP_4228 [Beggiatoa sp. PS]
MTYRVRLSIEAKTFYATTNQATAKKIARCLQQLEQNPYQILKLNNLKEN